MRRLQILSKMSTKIKRHFINSLLFLLFYGFTQCMHRIFKCDDTPVLRQINILNNMINYTDHLSTSFYIQELQTSNNGQFLAYFVLHCVHKNIPFVFVNNSQKN